MGQLAAATTRGWRWQTSLSPKKWQSAQCKAWSKYPQLSRARLLDSSRCLIWITDAWWNLNYFTLHCAQHWARMEWISAQARLCSFLFTSSTRYWLYDGQKGWILFLNLKLSHKYIKEHNYRPSQEDITRSPCFFENFKTAAFPYLYW